MKAITSIWISALVLSLAALDAVADAPYELYHVSRSSISVSILKESIGILTISSGIRKGKYLKPYQEKSGNWTPEKMIDALKTIPVSNFSYHPLSDYEGVGSFRFPILKKSGAFIKIAIDPVDAKSIWVSREDLDKDYFVKEDYFENFRPQELIDPEFPGLENARLYAKPSFQSETSGINHGQRFRVIGQKGDFLEVAEDEGDGEGDEEGASTQKTIEPKSAGWIPIHDKKGLLIIWVALVDNC